MATSINNMADGNTGIKWTTHFCAQIRLGANPSTNVKLSNANLTIPQTRELVARGGNEMLRSSFRDGCAGNFIHLPIVLLAHQHAFYEPNTPEDGERRAFHDGVIHSDLAGQCEFSWGEVRHRLEPKPNKEWLVVAYSHEARMPLPDRDDILRLLAHEIPPGDNF